MKKNTYYNIIGPSVLFTFIFLGLGLGFYLNGCNPNTSDTCLAYKPFNDATIYKITIEPYRSYTICQARCGNSCCLYSTKQYYNVYAFAHKGPSNSSYCYMELTHNSTLQHAEKQAKQYHVGENVDWLKEKYGDECITPGLASTYWTLGVVFLTLMGVAIIIGTVTYMIHSYNGYEFDNNKNKSNNDSNPNDNL